MRNRFFIQAGIVAGVAALLIDKGISDVHSEPMSTAIRKKGMGPQGFEPWTKGL